MSSMFCRRPCGMGVRDERVVNARALPREWDSADDPGSRGRFGCGVQLNGWSDSQARKGTPRWSAGSSTWAPTMDEGRRICSPSVRLVVLRRCAGNRSSIKNPACHAACPVPQETMIRSFIYDTLILRLTSRWYAEVLWRVPEGAALLDVGIGTAGALLANSDWVKRKCLRVTGIDVDADYVARAQRRLRDSPLAALVEVRLESFYDHQGGHYDAVYFSGSFMLLPEPEQALRHCRALVNPSGRIFFTQSIRKQPARWMEILKPMLKWVTSIDFGRVTYEDDFKAQIRAAGLELEEFTILAQHGSRASCIAVARPAYAGGAQEGADLVRAPSPPDAAFREL